MHAPVYLSLNKKKQIIISKTKNFDLEARTALSMIVKN